VCFYLSAGLAAAQSIIFYTTPETLNARDSKQVTSLRSLLAQANPLSLILLLLRNGPGLCALALTRVLWRAAVRVQSLLSPLQLGNREALQGMEWKPEEQGNYNGLLMPLLNIPLSRCFITPLLRISGTRDVWRISTLGSALGFVLIGQSFRRLLPLGALHDKSIAVGGIRFGGAGVLQFGLIQLLLIDAFVGATGISLQAMSIKHASSCILKEDGKVAGKGEINAAFSALDNLCDLVLPLIWASISSRFLVRAAFARADPTMLFGVAVPP
jgi:hypothetical protein